MQDLDHGKPADLTTEDHDWRVCGCNDCRDIQDEVHYSRGL